MLSCVGANREEKKKDSNEDVIKMEYSRILVHHNISQTGRYATVFC